MAKSPQSRPAGRRPQPAALEGNRVWRERSRVRRAGVGGGEKTLWERLPEWGQHAVCLGFLLAVALWFFAPVTFGGRTLVGGDTVQWQGAAEAMLDYEERTGEDALWASNVFGGMPGFMIHYPTATPGLDSIPRGLRELGLWPLAHFLALLGGTYGLVFFLTRSKWAGTLAAVAYGLTTYVPLILAAGHNTKFVAMAYAPWLLLAFAAALYRPDDATPLRDLLLALFFAMAAAVNLRAGHVQITYYVTFAALVWWIAEAVSAVRLGRTRRFAVSTLVLAGGAVLALAMVAQPYLAQWEYKAFTTRSAGETGGLAWDYAMAWSQGIGELVTLVAADAFGGGQLYWGPKPFTSGPHYFGAVVVLLAVFGVLGVVRRAPVGLAVAAGLMVLFALGEHLAPLNRLMFEVLPLFDSFRVPETWLAAVALVAAVLAGYGAYYVGRREATPEAEARKTRRLYLGLGVGLALLALVWLVGPLVLSFEREGEEAQVAQAVAAQNGVSADDPRVAPAVADYLRQAEGERRDLFRSETLRSLLFLGLAGLLFWLSRREKIPAWALQAGLVLLVTVDLGAVGRRYFNEDNPALRTRSDPTAAIPRYGFDGFLQERVAEAGGPGRFRVLSLESSPLQNARPAFLYESVGGYHGAKLALFQTYADSLLFHGGALNPNALNLLSTRYVVADRPLPGMEPVYQDPQSGLVVLENPDALPRAFLAGEAEVIEDERRALARLRDPAFDPARTVVLHEPVPGGFTPAPLDTASTRQVQLNRFSPREIVWEVTTDRPRLLVASEVFYPAGWTATVDDRPAPILRADHLLRAVPVPAGQHLVAMRFEPASHQTGLLVSWLATLLVYAGAAVLGGLLWYRKGHPAKP